MRTDAKIGFAIGGVLLAVLTVYAIVVPRHHKASSSNSVVVLPPQSDGSSASGTSGTPPIAAADNGSSTPVTPAKDTVAPPLQTGPATPSQNVADNTAGGGGPSSIDGFHPLVMPKDLPKADGQKSGKLVDGVYTPDNTTPRVAKSNRSDVSPLPDDVDVASTTSDSLYTIKSGQTLSKIAYEVYGNSRFWVVIQRENKGLDPNHLKVGAKIKLPDISSVVPGPVTVSDDQVAPDAMAETPRHASESSGESSGESSREISRQTSNDAHSYTVKSGDSLYGIAKRLLGSGRKADALYALNKEVIGPDKSKLKLGEVLKLPTNAPAAVDQ